MGRNNLIRNSLAIFTVSIAVGCVSVNIGDKKIRRSEGVSYRGPTLPFKALDGRGADQAWKNVTNGNMISYLSTCNDPADPTIENVQTELLSAFDGIHVKKSAARPFNGRQALNTEAEGLIDGVKTRIELLVFKKNDCTYTLTYVGPAVRFDQDQPQFQSFVNSFEAP